MSQKNTPSLPIGMFDSGVGGLTVLKEVMQKLPEDIFIYFGDTARCPYGGRSHETITRYSIESSIFLIEQGIEFLIIACNTASSIALDRLQKTFSIPIIGMIEPAVKKAAAVTKNKRIGVIGTRGTIGSGIYQKELAKELEGAQVFALACPLFVPLIEEQYDKPHIVKQVIKEYLAPLKEQKIDTLVLGCTHYPILQTLIEEEMQEGTNAPVTVINPAVALAETLIELKNEKLVSCNKGNPIANQKITAHQFYVSDDPKRFQEIGERFLGRPLSDVRTIITPLY